MYSGDSIGEGGNIYAYNAKTGTLLWNTTTPSMGYSGYWDNIPLSVGTFATGNLYWYGEEHSPSADLEPGFMIGELNATTGAPIWNITFWDGGGGIGSAMAIADGYIVALNSYDNQIYCFRQRTNRNNRRNTISRRHHRAKLGHTRFSYGHFCWHYTDFNSCALSTRCSSCL